MENKRLRIGLESTLQHLLLILAHRECWWALFSILVVDSGLYGNPQRVRRLYLATGPQ